LHELLVLFITLVKPRKCLPALAVPYAVKVIAPGTPKITTLLVKPFMLNA
jgi:hypothetical protein